MARGMASLALVAAAACCSKSEVKGGSAVAEPPPGPPSVTVFALAEVRGQIGPCGCTSDPLGDISRTAKLIETARAQGPVIVVDAGGLLYSQNPVPPHLVAQEKLKAALLQDIYWKDLQVAAVGLGASDLGLGPDATLFPRMAANLIQDGTTQPPGVVEVGSTKVGVFGVIAIDAVPGIKIEDPVVAGKRSVAMLRKNGAQIVIGLLQTSSKKEAVELARDIGGIDLSIAGLGLAAPEPDRIEIEPEKAGDGWVVIPANRGQVLSRIDIKLRGPGPLVDAVGPVAAEAKVAQIDKQLVSLDADLAKFAADKDADPSFVAAKKAERVQLVATRDHLKARPLEVPPRGSYFTLSQLKINKTLACSVPVQDAVKRYDQGAAEANVKAAAGKPVPQPPKGQASYVGTDKCDDCHSDEVTFWKKTVHAQAWQTLVDRGQQLDLECIGCHVTGWDRPGGTNLAHTENLRDVQCEVCHGPGSIHVAKGGEEKPAAVRRAPPEELCASQCHTHEHSDTFQYEAYLRDIVGPGHGADERKRLGDGPTGHELRSAALDKAGRTLGAGCTR